MALGAPDLNLLAVLTYKVLFIKLRWATLNILFSVADFLVTWLITTSYHRR